MCALLLMGVIAAMVTFKAVGMIRHQKLQDGRSKLSHVIARYIEMAQLRDKEIKCSLQNNDRGLSYSLGDLNGMLEGIYLKEERIDFSLPSDEVIEFSDGKRWTITPLLLQLPN